tara:strand:+ start:261 stop:1079 length:819 start_codon:yes stop_codon:yes gene_type:complete
MAEDPKNPSAQTYHIQTNRANAASFILYSTPFFPEIKEENDTIKVIFNQGYIFDHANMKTDDFKDKTSDKASIPRIKVEDLEHTHAENEEIEYSLEIQRNRKSGEVIAAKIIKSSNKSDALTFRNFIVENEIDIIGGTEILPDSAGANGENSYVYMDLADFQGFELKELYVRENIHVYYRGFEQLGKSDNSGNSRLEGGSDEVFPIINATGINEDTTQNVSTGQNGIIGIKAIAKHKNKGSKIEDQNILEIEQDENYIYLFVPATDTDHTHE